MAIYKYKAKNGPHDVVTGSVEALSENEAIDKISRMGYLPLRVEEEEAGKRERRPASRIFGRVRSRELTIFSRQLASLLKSGVPILNALNIIAEQTENAFFRYILDDLHNAVREGSGLSSVLSRYPRIFSPLYIAIVRSGEDSGSLPEVLTRIADYRAKQDEMVSRFRMAMAYPILMLIVGISTIAFMLAFVIPRLMRLFDNMGQSLPMPTRVLIYISNGIRHYWAWIILVVGIIVFLIQKELDTKSGKRFFSHLKLRLPLYGAFTLRADLARFCRTLEFLVRSGIPILKALDIAIPVLENDIIKDQLMQSHKELEEGGSFGRSLKGSKIFPLFMTNLIVIGEESGRLDEALSEIATSYERDTDETMKNMSSLLEPVMILVMGLAVGFIVIAMLLPVFEINAAIR